MVEAWKKKKRFQPKRKDHLTGSLKLPIPSKTPRPVAKIILQIVIPRCPVTES